MAVKVLVTAIGQQIISEVKQVENKDTKEVIAYWLENPRLVMYNQGEDGVNINFNKYCLISDEASFTIRADYVTSILEPMADVTAKYVELTEADAAPTTEEDATESDNTEALEPALSVAD